MSAAPRITRHAGERGRERLHWSRSALERMAPRILAEGLSIADTAGALRRFLESIVIAHHKGGNLRVWSHQVFIFEGEILITVRPLPPEFRRTADRLAARHKDRPQGGAA